jgi:hypothetical protein
MIENVLTEPQTRSILLGQMTPSDSKENNRDQDPENLLRKSALYKEFLAERGEILRHKWIESEKVGYDIGFERALLDWIVKYRTTWRKNRKNQPPAQ